MISESIDMYLETLAGYIFDDDKLVTYKWLSKELGLHVNLAKQILWQFLKEHEKGKDVIATFTLIGNLVEDNIYRVEIVRESDLSSAKKKFSKSTVEHLYSLQKALPDIELLALTDPGDHRQAAIICKEIIPREEGELSFLRWGSKFGNPGEKKTVLQSKEKLATSYNPKPNPPNNIFGKTIDAGKIAKETKSKIFDTRKEAINRGRKRQGSEDREAVIGSKRQKRKFDGDYRSSDDSVSGNENEEPAEIDCNPEEAELDREKIFAKASPPKYKMEQGKRKVRKIVDKTSLDDNGYIVTNKEYVYESCSDTEDPVDHAAAPKVLIETKKPQAPSTVLKANRNNNKQQQSSLLNFFKKS